MRTREAQPEAVGAAPRGQWHPHPAQVIFAGFAVTALVGTALLALPIARSGPGGATWLEAFFTSVSAICVTGLVVVDTASHWSAFGETVIIVLVQIGGLGVMTFASFVGIIVVRRMSFRSRLTTAAETKSLGLHNLRSLVIGVVKISLVIEAIAAIILTAQFALRYRMPVPDAVWAGVFHAVSAFNNAGFALFEDSMVRYVGDPVINFTLCAAIIIGGLGFPVIIELRKHLRRPLLWTMNTRLVLAASIALLIVGTVYIAALEWDNPATLGALDWPQRLLAGFFQSVQTRTSGFNTVDIGSMNGATLLGMDALMFIGGGPAGTSGGIKVTTFGVLFFIMLAEIRGDGVVNVFGKRLSRAVHRQAITVVLLSVAVVILASSAVMMMTDFDLGAVLFECISAFSTTGLSTGITAAIPPAGQLILCALMFLGRLGPITFATAIALRNRGTLYQLPKERPIIG